MSLKLRNSLDRKLTIPELDDNFKYLEELALAGGTGGGKPTEMIEFKTLTVNYLEGILKDPNSPEVFMETIFNYATSSTFFNPKREVRFQGTHTHSISSYVYNTVDVDIVINSYDGVFSYTASNEGISFVFGQPINYSNFLVLEDSEIVEENVSNASGFSRLNYYYSKKVDNNDTTYRHKVLLEDQDYDFKAIYTYIDGTQSSFTYSVSSKEKFG